MAIKSINFDQLRNNGMIDEMYGDWLIYKLQNRNSINLNALWQKWIRK